MQFHLSHKVLKAEGTTLTVQGPNGESKFEGDVVLIAVGRRPYSQSLGLKEVGIQTDPKGFVQIDASFRTSVPNIFAIGDLVEGPMLAHKASEEGVAAAELIAGHRPMINYIAIPNVAYTHPEVAAVGLTEDQIKERKIAYKSSQFPFKANSRARCIDDTEGFIKIFASETSKKILGVHMIGPSASELITEATLAIQLGATADQLADTCYAHPTFSETLMKLSPSGSSAKFRYIYGYTIRTSTSVGGAFCRFGCVKASKIDDRKVPCIAVNTRHFTIADLLAALTHPKRQKFC